MEIEGTSLDEKEMVVKNNFEFVSKYFNQDKVANLQYEYFSELAD
jgi:sulfur carrier protein ThiS